MSERHENWRIITPILLCLISAILTANSFILMALRADIIRVAERLESHTGNQEIHYGLKKDIDWIKTKLSEKRAWAIER